jgi:hypothetical protein
MEVMVVLVLLLFRQAARMGCELWSHRLLVSLHDVEDGTMAIMPKALERSLYRGCPRCFCSSPNVTRSRNVLKPAELTSMLMNVSHTSKCSLLTKANRRCVRLDH